MPMRAGPVFLSENLRPKRAVCCSFKVATTVIVILEIVINAILIFVAHIHLGVEITDDPAALGVIRGDTDVTRMMGNIYRTVIIMVTSSMGWGNFTDNKKLMMPYIFIKLGGLVLLIALESVLTLAYICLLKFKLAIVNLISATIVIVIGMFFWQIVQCRVIELDDMTRPNEVYIPGDPPMTNYGNVEAGTPVQTTGVPVTAPFVNDPIKATLTGPTIPY